MRGAEAGKKSPRSGFFSALISAPGSRCSALLLVFVLVLSGAGPRQAADLILLHGNVYTVNDAQPNARALAVKDGRFLFVGSDAEAEAFRGTGTSVVDLKGASVYPGFTDSHCHFLGIGKREMTLNLEGTASLKELLAKVRERTERANEGEWVTGRGWIETFWKPPVFPTRWDLDRVSPKNPVYLRRADGHGAVANSLALRIAKITRETRDPFGGRISRDGSGEPDGMFMDNAAELVTRHIPPVTEADLVKAASLAAGRSLRLGWTQLQDAGQSYVEISILKKLYMEGRLKLRVYEAAYGPGEAADRLIRDGATVGAFGGRFSLRAIKVSLDGTLGSRSAALLAPYSDDPGTSGLLTEREEDLLPLLTGALKAGIQVETHAIGDRANRLILDLYQRAFEAVPRDQRPVPDPRWRVEHAQVLAPQEIPRFAKLGVIPSMQPSHAISDLHFAIRRLGMERVAGAYAWRSLLKTGVVVPAGSDAPVERGEPMIEFYAAVSRKDPKGFSGEGWHPEQAVSREQALKMLTLWPAYAAFEEGARGSIEPGKLADLTVLSADIMKIPEADILKTRCVMTVIGGEIVYKEKD